MLTLLVPADAVAVNAVVPTLTAAKAVFATIGLLLTSCTVAPEATLSVIVEPSGTLAAAVATTLY